MIDQHFSFKEQLEFLEEQVSVKKAIAHAYEDEPESETKLDYDRDVALVSAIRDRIKLDYLIEKSLAESIVIDPAERIEIDDLISKVEFIKLSQSLKCDEDLKEIEMERLFKWATEMRSGAAIVDLLIDGTITVVGWEEGGTPALSVPLNFLTYSRREPMLKEMAC